MSNYKLDGTNIPVPHRFLIEDFDIRRDGRVASGLMTTDYIARKKNFTLHYNIISGTELNVIVGLIAANVFMVFTYPAETGPDTVTVTNMYLPRRLWANPIVLDKVYRDITMGLVER